MEPEFISADDEYERLTEGLSVADRIMLEPGDAKELLAPEGKVAGFCDVSVGKSVDADPDTEMLPSKVWLRLSIPVRLEEGDVISVGLDMLREDTRVCIPMEVLELVRTSGIWDVLVT